MEIKIILIYCVCSDFLKSINAVTSKGFEIKVFNFILAYTFKLLFQEKFALT